jgi:hypothetical protein
MKNEKKGVKGDNLIFKLLPDLYPHNPHPPLGSTINGGSTIVGNQNSVSQKFEGVKNKLTIFSSSSSSPQSLASWSF